MNDYEYFGLKYSTLIHSYCLFLSLGYLMTNNKPLSEKTINSHKHVSFMAPREEYYITNFFHALIGAVLRSLIPILRCKVIGRAPIKQRRRTTNRVKKAEKA